MKTVDVEPHAAVISSIAAAYATVDAPAPPYSDGVKRPASPASASARIAVLREGLLTVDVGGARSHLGAHDRAHALADRAIGVGQQQLGGRLVGLVHQPVPLRAMTWPARHADGQGDRVPAEVAAARRRRARARREQPRHGLAVLAQHPPVSVDRGAARGV